MMQHFGAVPWGNDRRADECCSPSFFFPTHPPGSCGSKLVIYNSHGDRCLENIHGTLWFLLFCILGQLNLYLLLHVLWLGKLRHGPNLRIWELKIWWVLERKFMPSHRCEELCGQETYYFFVAESVFLLCIWLWCGGPLPPHVYNYGYLSLNHNYLSAAADKLI